MTTIACESICKWNNRGKCQCKMITLTKRGSCYDKEPISIPITKEGMGWPKPSVPLNSLAGE